MSFASVTLLGRLGQDPKMSYTKDGTAFTSFSIATDRKGKGGTEETVWWNCTAFRGQAETIYTYCHKGDQVLITGTPSQREYTKRDGGVGYSLDVAVDKFSFAGSKKTDTGGSVTTYGGSEEALPDDDPLAHLA